MFLPLFSSQWANKHTVLNHQASSWWSICWQGHRLWPRIRAFCGKILKQICQKLMRMPVVYFWKYLAFHGTPLHLSRTAAISKFAQASVLKGLKCQVQNRLKCQVLKGLKCQVLKLLKCQVRNRLKCQVQNRLKYQVLKGLNCQVLKGLNCRVLKGLKCLMPRLMCGSCWLFQSAGTAGHQVGPPVLLHTGWQPHESVQGWGWLAWASLQLVQTLLLVACFFGGSLVGCLLFQLFY